MIVKRAAVQGWAGFFIVPLFLSGFAAAATTHTINVGGDPSLPNRYATLEDFRTIFLQNSANYAPGDTFEITLHGDDDSLTDLLEIPAVNIILRTDGPVYTVSGSRSTSSYGPLIVEGGVHVSVTDSAFAGNPGASAMSVYNGVGETTDVDIAITGNAPDRVVWDSDRADVAMFFAIDGAATVNATIAVGKTLEIGDYISGIGTGTVTLNKYGPGTLKLGAGGVLGDGVLDAVVSEGTLWFGDASVWGSMDSNLSPTGGLRVKAQGVFKPSLTAGNIGERLSAKLYGQPVPEYTGSYSVLALNTFHAEPGARLEIGGVSGLPILGKRVEEGANSIKTEESWVGFPILQLGDSDNSDFNLGIDNRLLRAKLIPGSEIPSGESDPDSAYLFIDWLENLSAIDGVGDYADVYRQLSTLSEAEREMLDHIYNTGGAGNGTIGFLQTVGGVQVGFAQLAMRHNLANVRKNINARLTNYQREELEEPLSVGAGGYPSLISRQGDGEYSGIWAYAGRTWVDQDDVGDAAGYKYRPFGIGIGYEKHAGEWIVGGLASYDSGTMKLKSLGATRTGVQNVLLSGYASYAANGYYASGGIHLGYGWNDTASAYALPGFATARGSYDSWLYGVSGEFGYMLDGSALGNDVRITPHGGFAYAQIVREGFAENGGGALARRFSENRWNVLELELGVRLSMPFEYETHTLVPSLDLVFARTMGTPGEGANDTRLLSNPLGTWHSAVLDKNRNALGIRGGLEARFRSGFAAGADIDFEFRRKGVAGQMKLNVSKGF
ncbi:MAG: autotransporter outer membrane beta-barrel domain-containing protein [Planctomycetota bacterium]|jgi:hypothetical protein|nr:autotransporter outer membrane beta-barrel domain-containing protein [Planctomycetota bacterium]